MKVFALSLLVLLPVTSDAFTSLAVRNTDVASRCFPIIGSNYLVLVATAAAAAAADSSETDDEPHRISIEYCTGCRWMLKSFWMAQELLTTFEQDLDAVTVLPSPTKGIFAVHLNGKDLLWDRKEQGGFPSPKGLKQIVRDMVAEEKFLGHSDTAERQENGSSSSSSSSSSSGEAVLLPLAEALVTPEDHVREDTPLSLQLDAAEAQEPSITITYCTGCKWLLRAAYFGQEILTTFGDEIKSVTLVPSKPPAKGGQFSVALNGEVLFDRATEGRFPEVKEVKQMIRDKVIPDKDLGHSDIQDAQEMEDEDAEDAREFFGVA